MTLPLGLFGMFSPTELLVILVIVLVLFGGKKLPDLAKSLGRSMGEFKKGKEEGERLANESTPSVAADANELAPKRIESPKA